MCLLIVIKRHDDVNEGLPRATIISMVIRASGNTLDRKQAARTWDRTIHPLGKKLGLLTGYVKPQAGSSKRTAAGAETKQRRWHEQGTSLIATVTKRAEQVLGNARLVAKMKPSLIGNFDEEHLNAMSSNALIVGSKTKKKHDNQNASSRFVGLS